MRRANPRPTFRVGSQERSDSRLGELILLVADKSSDDPRFGAIKLNKILWRLDTLSFIELGQPITGTEYQKLQFGPAPRRLVPVRRQLVQEGHIERKVNELPDGREQERIIPLRPGNKELFDESELEIVDRVIEEMWEFNAKEASERSHGKAWETARDGGSIPYEAALLSDEKLTEEDKIWALNEATELGRP